MGFVGNKQKDKFSEKEGGHEYPEHPPPPPWYNTFLSYTTFDNNFKIDRCALGFYESLHS